MKDLTRRFSQKRSVSVFSATLNLTELGATGLDDTVVRLANLPDNIIIKQGYVFVADASNVVDATVALTANSTAIGVAADIDAAGVVEVDGGLGFEVGPTLTATFSTKTHTKGRVTIVLEYTEYEKTSGELTKVTA